MGRKPATIEAYKEWMKSVHRVDTGINAEKHFETQAEVARAAFASSPLWAILSDQERLLSFDAEYRIAHANHPLFATPPNPVLDKKSFKSALEKSFRINVVNNRDWPEPPRWRNNLGYVVPRNWFFRLNDIVRTYFVVRYLDGVKFFIDKLVACCDEVNLKGDTHFEARDDGYYAAHFYVTFPCEIAPLGPSLFDRLKVDLSVEIQVTTQLQEVIRTLLHDVYASHRASANTDRNAWKWDHNSRQFSTNYLGHILHYIEGTIVQLRDKESK